MTSLLSALERCAEIAGLRGDEIVLGVSPGSKHERMLDRYRRVASPDEARVRLVAEIREALRMAAPRRAADLLIVLRRLLAEGAGFCAVSARDRARRKNRPTRAGRGAPPLAYPAPPAQAASREGSVVLAWRGDCRPSPPKL